MNERISISIIIKEESQKTSSEISYFYRVCKDKESFEEIFDVLYNLSRDAADDFYELSSAENG